MECGAGDRTRRPCSPCGDRGGPCRCRRRQDAPAAADPAAHGALLRQAAAALLRDGHPAEAAELCRITGPATPLVRLYLRALREAGDPARLVEAANSLAGRADLDEPTQNLIAQLRRADPRRVGDAHLRARAEAAARTAMHDRPAGQGLPLPGPVADLLADARLVGPAGIPADAAAAIATAMAATVAAEADKDRARPAGRFSLAVIAARGLLNADQPLAAALVASAAHARRAGRNCC